MSTLRSVRWCLGTFALLAAAFASPAADEPKPDKWWVYVGTYTSSRSKGIYLLEMDSASGKLAAKGLAAEVASPSFLAIHPNRKFLYAVNEIGDFQGKKTGAVSSFALDAMTGQLRLLNQQSSGGAHPCHLVVDREGKNVLVANYTGGSVASLPIDPDGRLREASSFIQHKGSSVNPNRQEGPHAHSINLDAGNRFACAADLGLDQVLVYRYDPAKGTLTLNATGTGTVAPGAGPRHFAFHPNGKYAYVINEMNSTVTAFNYNAEQGVLKVIQTVPTLPEGFKGSSSCAEVQVHPSGKFVYGSNRGHDSLAIFTVDAATGRLTPAGHQATGGKTPRNFGIDPAGDFLLAANQSSDIVVVFRIDQQTGALLPTRQVVTVPAPVCVKFLAVAK